MKFYHSSLLRNSLAVLIVLLGAFSRAHAMFNVPEIDPSLGIGGLALLSGVVLMVRGRRRK
jgi:LPXTG-motif cell wall-anchored protein